MPPAEVSRQEGLTLWRIPELGLEFELPLMLVADIVAAAKEGFNRFPRGGLEVGGVLFGRREGERVRVLAARSIPCKYLLGPSFTLSPEEHEELSALLVGARQNPELAGLIPVGWYHSHTRSGLLYTDADAHLHNRHFPQSWQLGLVLRPGAGKPTQIGVFLRAKDGELALRPALVVHEDSLAAAVAPGNSGTAEPPEEGPEPPQPVPAASRPGIPRSLWAAPVVALAVLAAGALGLRGFSWPELGVYWRRITNYWWPAAEGAGQRPFQLAVEAANDKLLVRWNPAAPGVAASRDVKLILWDGNEKREALLDASTLERGTLALERRSDRVTVIMTSLGGANGPLRETAYLVGAPPAPAEGSSGLSRLPALLEERERLETALKVSRAEADALAEQRASLQRLLQSRPPREPPPAPKPRPALVEKAPEAAAPPVVLAQRPAAIPPSAPSGVSPVKPPTMAAKPEAAANAGRLIWTGALGAGRVLTISGRQASLGSFTGQLPGVPVRVQVFPAELASAGLIVYTLNPKHAGADLAEPPGPGNSWTRTLYRYAPERADSLQVIQAPAAANGWLGLTLRANANISAIVVDWEILR